VVLRHWELAEVDGSGLRRGIVRPRSLEPSMYFRCQNSRMSRCLALSSWRVSAFAFTLLLPIATRSAAYQLPAQQSEQRNANELKLTAAQEKDSYEIYSILLRAEMPPQWKLTGWAIRHETQTFPTYGSSNGGNLRMCLQPSQDQQSIYVP
jgi:hypothetical protein